MERPISIQWWWSYFIRMQRKYSSLVLRLNHHYSFWANFFGTFSWIFPSALAQWMSPTRQLLLRKLSTAYYFWIVLGWGTKVAE